MTKKIALSFLALCIGIGAFAQTFNSAKLDSLFTNLEAKDKYMGSIVLSENGKTIFSKTIGKADVATGKAATNATKYRIGSISKTFTACLIFKAVEEGKLDLNKTIEGYFPAVQNAAKISISNLLNHRSGIHSFTDDEDYLSYNTKPISEKEMVALIAKGKAEFEPNSKAEYSNSNYVLLSYILEKIYKKPYALLVDAKICKPLGLKNTYFGGKTNIANNECYSYTFDGTWQKESETDMSVPMGAGALVSNPTDLTKFIEALFAGKIISQKSLDQMITLQDNYGMGIFRVPFYESKGYGHTGGIDGFSSSVSYFPDSKLAIAVTSNGNTYDNNQILICALSSYFGKPFKVPSFNTIEVKPEDLDLYIGEYSAPEIPLIITIRKEGNTISAQATGQNAFPLDAVSKDVFEFPLAGIKLVFNTAEKQMTLDQGGMKLVMTKK